MTVGLQVDNFATLRHAQISLNKLLVLMGPNNSGKSTAAILLYAACRSIPSWKNPTGILRSRSIQSTIGSPEFDRRYVSRTANELITAARNFRTRGEMAENFPPSARSIMTRPMKQLLGVYVRSFAKELERCFGGTLKELVRQPSNGQSTRVQVSYGDRWMVAINITRRRTSYEVMLNEMDDNTWSNIVGSYLQANWAKLRGLRFADADDAVYILDEIFSFLVQYHFRHFPRTAHYLPASRSGTLQSHRALAAAMIRQSSYAGIEDLAIPKLPGVVADFIGKLLVLNPNRIGPYKEIAARLQQEVLHGEIELSPTASTAPEISFAVGEVQHALHRTSSMVSELAPIILLLRHVVSARDLIIIEEPESHLHPAGQVGLATTIARLVSSGVSVAITTHSDYFINRISNLVMKAAIAESGASDEASETNTVAISPNSASAYLFRPVDANINSGSVVEELPVTTSGISDTEFAQVAEWLYNESALLTQKVNSIDA